MSEELNVRLFEKYKAGDSVWVVARNKESGMPVAPKISKVVESTKDVFGNEVLVLDCGGEQFKFTGCSHSQNVYSFHQSEFMASLGYLSSLKDRYCELTTWKRVSEETKLREIENIKASELNIKMACESIDEIDSALVDVEKLLSPIVSVLESD